MSEERVDNKVELNFYTRGCSKPRQAGYSLFVANDCQVCSTWTLNPGADYISAFSFDFLQVVNFITTH